MLWADCCRWPRSNNGERALLLSRSCSSSSRGRSRLGIEPRSVDRLVAHRTVRASVGTYGLLEDDTLASVGALPLRFDTVVASRLLLVAFDTPLSTSLVICQTLAASLYSNQLCRVLQRGLGLRKKKKKGGEDILKHPVFVRFLTAAFWVPSSSPLSAPLACSEPRLGASSSERTASTCAVVESMLCQAKNSFIKQGRNTARATGARRPFVLLFVLSRLKSPTRWLLSFCDRRQSLVG